MVRGSWQQGRWKKAGLLQHGTSVSPCVCLGSPASARRADLQPPKLPERWLQRGGLSGRWSFLFPGSQFLPDFPWERILCPVLLRFSASENPITHMTGQLFSKGALPAEHVPPLCPGNAAPRASSTQIGFSSHVMASAGMWKRAAWLVPPVSLFSFQTKCSHFPPRFLRRRGL